MSVTFWRAVAWLLCMATGGHSKFRVVADWECCAKCGADFGAPKSGAGE